MFEIIYYARARRQFYTLYVIPTNKSASGEKKSFHRHQSYIIQYRFRQEALLL